MGRILVVDNYDSFTWNLVHYLEAMVDDEVTVWRNDAFELSQAAAFDRLVLSPGPGLPEESGLLMPLIQMYAHTKPILGVCLGHQALAIAMGAKLRQLDQVLHGVQRKCIVVHADPILDQVPTEFPAGRYHSWVIDERSMPDTLMTLAKDEDGCVMVMRHTEKPLYGVQFHPESIMTNSGKQILANWIACTAG